MILEPERRPHGDPAVEGNARLTGYAAMLLLGLLAAEGATLLGIRHLLEAHVLIGLLLVPPVMLKLGSVGYRFGRYYLGDPGYRAAGPPALAMRLLGPLVVVLTLAVLATGIELWLFGYRFGYEWLTWHKLSFGLWFLAMSAHVLAYLRRAPALALADWNDRLSGALTRRSLLVASLLLGVVLAAAFAVFPSPFVLLPDNG